MTRRLLVVLFVFALVVAACSSDDSTDSETTTTAAAAEETTTTAAAGEETTTTAASATTEAPMVDLSGTSVTVFSSEDGVDEATGIQRALDVFAAETGIEIKHTGARDFSEQINAQVVGGNPPDIAMFPQPGKVRDFASQDYILPLDPAVDAAVRPQWPAGTLETYSVDGVAYAVQAKTDLKSIVWYNTQVFADGGYEIPTTLDELWALSTQMIADGQTPWCIGIESGPATGWTFTDWMEDMMLRLEGPEAYDEWLTNALKFDDPRVIAVGEAILNVWNTPGNTYAAGGSIAATAHSADNGQPLADGTCAMVRQASFFGAFLPEGTPVGPDGAVDTFYFPAVDASSSPVLTAGNAAAALRDAPEVWAVMEYLGSTQYAQERQKAQREIKGGDASGFLTANLDVDLSLWNELEGGFIKILASADPARFDGSDNMPSAVGAGSFWTEGTSAVNGDKTVADAFKAIQATWP